MAKLTVLDELTTPVDPDDLLYVVHAPATTASSMKVKASRFGGPPSTNGFRLTLAPLNPVYAPQPATPASTDTTADTCTFTLPHGWESGTIVTVSATGGGLTAGTRYFLNKVSTTVVSFHTAVANAIAGTSKVDLTASITAQVIPSGISNSTLYLTPFNGAQIGLYNGAAWVQLTSAEVSLALGTLTSDKNYDVFAYSNAGVLTLELLAWTSDTVRATAIIRQDGVWCKTGALTRRYIGTIRTDSTTTTIDDEGGIASQVGGKRFVWNMDNRRAAPLNLIDTTPSWNYITNTWRQSNGAAGNKCEIVQGLAEDAVYALVLSLSSPDSSSMSAAGIGIDSTTPKGLMSLTYYSTSGPASSTTVALTRRMNAGYHYLAWLEIGNGSGSTIWYGSNNNTRTQSGMTGTVYC